MIEGNVKYFVLQDAQFNQLSNLLSRHDRKWASAFFFKISLSDEVKDSIWPVTAR